MTILMKSNKIIISLVLITLFLLTIILFFVIKIKNSNYGSPNIDSTPYSEIRKQKLLDEEKSQKQFTKEIIRYDVDNDSVFDDADNCPLDYNPNQENIDNESVMPISGEVLAKDNEGDACDWDDVFKGSNEDGIDCGGLSQYSCADCYQ
jgi:hypothetical protein